MLNRTTPSPWKGDVQPLHQIRILCCYPGRIRTYEITEPNSVALDRWATGQLFVEQVGFEPTTFCLKYGYSNQLSYEVTLSILPIFFLRG